MELQKARHRIEAHSIVLNTVHESLNMMGLRIAIFQPDRAEITVPDECETPTPPTVPPTSRRFVIGDIHGCAHALNQLVDHLQLTSNDSIICLGDTVDRGPDSREVLERLLEIRQTCELVLILGNHEEMMLTALKGQRVNEWLRHGGTETLASYNGDPDNIPDDHLELLKSAARYWEGPTEICVHANLEPGIELRRQRSSWLRWNKLTGREHPHPSGKRVICGHSGTGYGAPVVRNGWICLDTMVYRGGLLSALDLETGEILQSRQNGEFRRGVYLHEIES